jgi:hypothetical protein
MSLGLVETQLQQEIATVGQRNRQALEDGAEQIRVAVTR